MADHVVPPDAPKLTKEQELNMEYNRLCTLRGDIEFKILTQLANKESVEEEIKRLSQQRDSNVENMIKLSKKASQILIPPPAAPNAPPQENLPEAASLPPSAS